MEKSLAERVWEIGVARREIFRGLRVGKLYDMLCLSKQTFPEVAREIYAEFWEDDYKKVSQILVPPVHLAMYFSSVETFHCRSRVLDTFGTWENVVRFTRIQIIRYRDWTVNFTHHATGYTAICVKDTGHSPNYRTNSKKFEFDSPFPTSWTTAISRLVFDISDETLSSHSEDEDDPSVNINKGIKCLLPALALRLVDLYLSGCITLNDFPQTLKRHRERENSHVIESVLIRTDTYSLEDVNRFLQEYGKYFLSINLEAEKPQIMLESMWANIQWSSLKGVRELKLSASLMSSSGSSSTGSFESALIQRPATPVDCLHLRYFSLSLIIPEETELHHDTIAECLPQVWEVGEFMLDIGGPLCHYHLSVEQEDRENEHKAISYCLETQVTRYINHLIDRLGEKPGWQKVSRE